MSNADFTILRDLDWITIPNSPNAPADLRVTAASPSTIYLTWQDKSDYETGFKVFRKYQSFGYKHIKTLPADTTSFLDYALQSKYAYTYKVQAYNSDGFNESNEASATTYPLTPPAAPTNLRAIAISSSSIELYWADSSVNEKGFRIFQKVRGGYFLLISTQMFNTQVYRDTDLAPNTQYTYKVQAYNYGFSDSNQASATTFPHESAVATFIRFYVGSTNCYVDDALAGINVAPVIYDGRTLVPIRYIADPLGADITWDSSTGKATISLGNNVVELWIM